MGLGYNLLLGSLIYVVVVLIEALSHAYIIKKNGFIDHNQDYIKLLTFRGISVLSYATLFQIATGYYAPTLLLVCLTPFIHWVFFDAMMNKLLSNGLLFIPKHDKASSTDKFFHDKKSLHIASKVASLILVISVIWLTFGRFGLYLLSFE